MSIIKRNNSLKSYTCVYIISIWWEYKKPYNCIYIITIR